MNEARPEGGASEREDGSPGPSAGHPAHPDDGFDGFDAFDAFDGAPSAAQYRGFTDTGAFRQAVEHLADPLNDPLPAEPGQPRRTARPTSLDATSAVSTWFRPHTPPDPGAAGGPPYNGASAAGGGDAGYGYGTPPDSEGPGSWGGAGHDQAASQPPAGAAGAAEGWGATDAAPHSSPHSTSYTGSAYEAPDHGGHHAAGPAAPDAPGLYAQAPQTAAPPPDPYAEPWALRHAEPPAADEAYAPPGHGRHAGAPPTAGDGRDPSPWGDLSQAARAGDTPPATEPTAYAAPATPTGHATHTEQPTHTGPAAHPAPAGGPPPAAGAPAGGAERVTWGAGTGRGISGTEDGTQQLPAVEDGDERTVQTMSLNVARSFGSRMAARRAARAAKQQRTILISRITGEAFITLGVLMLLFVAYQLWWTNVLADRASGKEAKQLEEQWDRGEGKGRAEAEEDRSAGAFEPGEGFAIMYLPDLDVKAPIAEGIDKHEVLDRGLLGHYADGELKTAMPWDEEGNFAVAGHRNTHGEPFRYINKLEPGDQIIVETKDTFYVYETTNTLPSTSPSNTGVIDPIPEGSGFTEPGRYVTLTTCTPEYTSKYRLIVWGKMVEERPRSEGKPDALVE